MKTSLLFSHRGYFHQGDENYERNLRFSRHIKTLNYDNSKEMLSIYFCTGNTQNYCKVPDNIYKELESSLDQNGYYNNNIYGKYQIKLD